MAGLAVGRGPGADEPDRTTHGRVGRHPDPREEGSPSLLAYLRRRTSKLRYAEYKAAHIPLGGGITEAACKTIFKQRLKLSGRRWSSDVSQQILTLRTIQLSGTWDATYAKLLADRQNTLPVPYAPKNPTLSRTAA
jgi:hypothetical protein